MGRDRRLALAVAKKDIGSLSVHKLKEGRQGKEGNLNNGGNATPLKKVQEVAHLLEDRARNLQKASAKHPHPAQRAQAVDHDHHDPPPYKRQRNKRRRISDRRNRTSQNRRTSQARRRRTSARRAGQRIKSSTRDVIIARRLTVPRQDQHRGRRSSAAVEIRRTKVTRGKSISVERADRRIPGR